MLKIIQDCFTEKDGVTYDSVRILGAISFFVYNFITIYRTLSACNTFNPIDYASGMAILLGVISAGVTLKYSKE